MAPDISPGSVLLSVFHLLGGVRCWGASGQEADSKCHSYLLHQYQSVTPAHLYTVTVLIPKVTEDYVSLFAQSLYFTDFIHSLSPSLISFSGYFLKDLFFYFSCKLKYTNSLISLPLPYILHLQ